MPRVPKFHKANSQFNGEWGKQKKFGKRYTSHQRRSFIRALIKKELEQI